MGKTCELVGPGENAGLLKPPGSSVALVKDGRLEFGFEPGMDKIDALRSFVIVVELELASDPVNPATNISG